jgi:uncharacterized protein YdeI (YjbR/CyaY-like superfamily)
MPKAVTTIARLAIIIVIAPPAERQPPGLGPWRFWHPGRLAGLLPTVPQREPPARRPCEPARRAMGGISTETVTASAVSDAVEPELRAGLPIIAFPNAVTFDDWLGANAATTPGIWMKLSKSSATERTLTKTEAIDAALCHGWIDGQLGRYDDDYWLARFTPRRPKSIWSRINRDNAVRLSAAGRMRPAGLAQIEAAKADGRWAAAYEPASTATVPQDLRDALAEHPRAAAFFARLKGANRYAVLYRIQTAKKPETRARKIAQLVGMLERGEMPHG